MQVTITELSPVEKKVAVEIPWQYVAGKLDKAYRELGKGVALAGFRKGKVPRPMLEKMFGPRIEQDVMRELVQESFFTAAHEHDLQPVAEPVVDDAQFEKGKAFHYSARVEVRSIVEPKEYDGISLTERAPKVTDADVDRAVERKREELTEFRPIEEGRTVAAETDALVVALKGKVGERDVERDGVMVDLTPAAQKQERDYVPGLAAALVGVALDAKDHNVEFTVPNAPDEDAQGKPSSQARKDLSGLKATLAITVKEARMKHVPALDDELAKDTGEGQTLAELRDKLREKLVSEDSEDRKNELKQALVKELLKRNPFAVAPALVERQLDAMLQRAKLGMAIQGVDVKNLNLDEQRVRDELREQANDEVRAAFLIDAIGTKESVEVSEADMEKRLTEMAKIRDKSVARLKAELQKEGRLDGIKHSLREEKTLDLLLTRAKIEVAAG
jgi:trigger factor